MASIQYAVLLLTLAMPVHECKGIQQRTRCTSQPPCFDLLIVERMARRISKDVPGADNDNILIKSKMFDKIRQKKKLHSCVLEKIFEFYKKVLASDEHIQNYHLDMIYILDRVRNCTYKMKKCGMLYQKANQKADIEVVEEHMSAQEAAIFQLQKLNHASERINDTTILKTAMDELKSLHHYIPGRAFRKRKQMAE